MRRSGDAHRAARTLAPPPPPPPRLAGVEDVRRAVAAAVRAVDAKYAAVRAAVAGGDGGCVAAPSAELRTRSVYCGVGVAAPAAGTEKDEGRARPAQIRGGAGGRDSGDEERAMLAGGQLRRARSGRY